MDGNVYAVEVIAAARLTELRAGCARVALIESVRADRRRGLGTAVGGALIRVGQWLARDDAAAGPNAGVRVAR
jgi:hypothetical protein